MIEIRHSGGRHARSFEHPGTDAPPLCREPTARPRRGACFMEFASYLAGERWSDHPACTDPVLAALARGVNDNLSDRRRDEIVHEIPRVIGLRGDDSVVGLVVALRAAIAALPVASMDRQRSLALGILALRPALAARGVELPRARRARRPGARRCPGCGGWATPVPRRPDVEGPRSASHRRRGRRPGSPTTGIASRLHRRPRRAAHRDPRATRSTTSRRCCRTARPTAPVPELVAACTV